MKYNYKDERLGYYVVNGIEITNKVQALEYATKCGVAPTWVFNNSTFDHVNWEYEPSQTIGELYAQRARGLREKYDYLVINYSAGSDSQNILDTFINNNIKVDEILVRWFKKAVENKYRPSSSPSAHNFNSEWDLTLYPALEKIHRDHPEIKIHFHDTSDDAFEFYKNDEWLYTTNGCHLDPCAIFQFDLGYSHYRNMADRGIRVGQIFGIDKPRVICKDGVFYTYFLDILTGVAHFTLDDRLNEYNKPELFYWSPESVPLIQKQAHLVMKFFKKNPELLPFIDFANLKTPAVRSTYENLIRKLIYPTWDINKFQVAKPSSVFHCEYDDWFFQRYEGLAPVDIWKEGLEYVGKNIESKYLAIDVGGQLDNFVGFISPFYKLGSL